MKERKLNYRFHNPNSEAVTIDYILKTFMEVNKGKAEAAIWAAAKAVPDDDEGMKCSEGHPA